MNKSLPTLLLCAALAIAGCSRSTSEVETPARPQPGLQAWTLPAGPGSAQPGLSLAPDGRLLLSWMESVQGRRTRFQYADFTPAGQWQITKTIAIGSSFFVNWADTPHMIATPNGALWVQWLQKSAEAPGAYDVMLATSRDDGGSWDPPVRPHTDGTASEHGFVSLWAQGDDKVGIAWLDGRSTVAAPKHGDDPHAHHGGATMLRGAVFDLALATQGDMQIDPMVCDCCQTDAAMTSEGALLVYRGRTSAEIRDIQTTRFDGKTWTTPKPVAADHWKMPACPVNGPSVAARGEQAVVGWYTAVNDTPTVQLARSTDAGDTFGAPVVLDQGEAVQGRISVAMDAGNVWVLWLREDASGQSLWLARYTPDLSRQLEKVEVAKLHARGRGTGFPQLALRDGMAYMAWTDSVDGVTRLHGARFVPAP